MDEQVKSVDQRSGLRFRSVRKRAFHASANVYQRYKKSRLGDNVTAASMREEKVHYPPARTKTKTKPTKRRTGSSSSSNSPSGNAILVVGGKDTTTRTTTVAAVNVRLLVNEEEVEELQAVTNSSSSTTLFAQELDLAMDRNASEVFGNFYRAIWSLVRSLPEVLHHAATIVELLTTHLLSPVVMPLSNDEKYDNDDPTAVVVGYEINHATTDILHLLAVLARDLRHEIHPFVHTQIIPRILHDLLGSNSSSSNQQQQPLNVTTVEAAFRTLAYIFRYDCDNILGHDNDSGECLRQYYGQTLAHGRDLVRRLAAETFAPLVRKIKTVAGRTRHVRRVLRALAMSASSVSSSTTITTTSTTTTKTTTSRSKRLQQDAVDGIAWFLFHIASSSVKGQMHRTSGPVVLQCVLDCVRGHHMTNVTAAGHGLVQQVASLFLARWCFHLQYQQAAQVLSTIMAAARKQLVESDENATRTKSIHAQLHTSHLIQLVHEMIQFRDGVLLQQQKATTTTKEGTTAGAGVVVEQVIELLEQLLVTDRFLGGSMEHQTVVSQLVCTTWKVLCTKHATCVARLQGSIQLILVAESSGGDDASMILFSRLMHDLIPLLPTERAMTSVGNSCLSAAAQLCQQHPARAVAMVHALSSSFVQPRLDHHPVDDCDQVLQLSHAQHCCVSANEHQQLLDVCMQTTYETKKSNTNVREWLAHIAIAAKATAFMCLVPSPDQKQNRGNLKKACRYLLLLLTGLTKDKQRTAPHTVSMCIIIDALARLCTTALSGSDHDAEAVARRFLQQAQPMVEELLQGNPSSLWVTKCSAAFVQALQKLGLTLCSADHVNDLLDKLIPNLFDCNHFRRLHSLEILCSFPKRPFVVDHADIDWTDDLDEEPSGGPSSGPSGGKGLSGICHMMDTLLEIERTPVYFSKERYIASLISRVEVLGRTGKLPVAYAESAASHMLGLLHIKFAPIWTAAVKALAALSKGHEDCVWPFAHEQLSRLMKNVPYRGTDCTVETESPLNNSCDPVVHYQLCVDWESSNGTNASLFVHDITRANEAGRVSRHRSTDVSTVLESLWNVFVEAPSLLSQHSKTMVPLVLGFLHNQYYTVHPNDPDARELDLVRHVPTECGPDSGKTVDRRAVQQRLLSILKAFASVNGPQQLCQHKLLFSIFLSFLGHSDHTVAQLALDCVLRFKPAYLVPYAAHLKKFYAKGKLREALLQLGSADEDGSVIHDHRSQLLPVLCRVLFGRLSARAVEGRSSKDSPSARRSAILSFVSTICKDEHELYSFMYLMVRPYIPKKYATKAIELQDEEYRGSLIGIVQDLSPDEYSRLPTQVHQGFLNTLEAVVAQLGHKVQIFIPAFISIVLALSGLYSIDPSLEEDLGENTAGNNEPHELERAGSVRGLCYRRLAEMFDTFSDTVDFDRYSMALWSAVQESLIVLPKMATHAEKAPALLVLLKTLSSKPKLVKMLANCEDAVPSVLKCFARGSGMSVVDASLTFIDNLMTDENGANDSPGEASNNLGLCMVENHIGLLLQQFRDRLDCAGESRSMTWRRELAILCRVSDLVKRADEKNAPQVKENAESLCSLLIPFLDHGRGCGDSERSNVLGILEALVPMVPPETAIIHYMRLSKLLGPYKTTSGIATKPVRVALANVVKVLAHSVYNAAGPASCILVRLCAVSDKRVDEIDFDAVIPALVDLGDSSKSSSWNQLCKVEEETNPPLLLPLIYCCFHLLFCEDGVVARGSFRCLKALIALASEKSAVVSAVSEDEREKWLKILEGCVIPLSRSGLASRDASIRRYYILLLRDVARLNRNASSPNLHGDLAHLVQDEDQDLDFFISITHVQLHRRARALQRLRKSLNTDNGVSRFRPQSLSHVLLPLALHPVYETVTKVEDSFALEGIATAGAISRLLSWSKYNNILWTTLTQFHRHPDQEPYLVGLLCAFMDGFHFEIDAKDIVSVHAGGSSATWRALEKRFIPKIEGLLIKEKVNGKGEKVKMLRPSIVLALLKLFKKLPAETFRSKLPRLLTVICDALKSKESNARDVARSTLAKIAVEIEIDYLADIVRELAITLTEGYRLHVRSATIHTVLLELSTTYKPPEASEITSPLPFDKTVPALMDLIQQDIFGIAQERKQADGSLVRYVKEAGGSKSMHALELIASMIVFKPSMVNGDGGRNVSSIHALVIPFLERLRIPGLQMRVLRQIKDCLSRVVAGLQRNPSINNDEVLPYVYATLEPFVSRREMQEVVKDMDDESNSDEDDGLEAVHVSGAKKSKGSTKGQGSTSGGSVAEWRPSTLGAPKTAKAAQSARTAEITAIRRVKDGASAPRLTGSGRNGQVGHSSSGVNDPATISAVAFGLRLLGASLKNSTKTSRSSDMLDPFVPLLTTCVCRCRDSDVVLLSLKCLGWLMLSELPSLSRCAKSLATKTLELLTSSGAATNLNQDLLQASFKMLTFLVNYDRKFLSSTTPSDTMELGESAMSKTFALPLDAEQMQVLLSFLQGSLVDSDHHTPAIGLVKAIMSRKYVSAELYDLMETLLELSVRSSKSSLREQSSAIIVSFLINYPLSEERLEQHLQQILLNLKYEYSDGRLSAIALVTSIIEKFPTPLVEQHCQMFFLPLALQLVNDDSKECREQVASCIKKLLERLSTNSLQHLFDYTERWSEGTATNLQKMSLQLYGIFIESQADFLKRGDASTRLLGRIEKLLVDQKEEWEVGYFALLSLEKMAKAFPKKVALQTNIWQALVRTMTSRHAWVKQASVRLLCNHLSPLDAKSFADQTCSTPTFLVKCPGALYQVARNFCFQLAAEEEEQIDDLVPLIVKSLTWTLQAMDAFPHLCFDDSGNNGSLKNDDSEEEDEAEEDEKEEGDEDDKDDGGVKANAKSDPVLWLMMRLSNIAKPQGTKRRQAIFKCFAAFCTFAGDICHPHMELMLAPLLRAESEQTSRHVHPLYATAAARAKASELTEEGQLIHDVMHLLEEKSPDNVFIEALGKVKKRALEKSRQRKLATKTEYVLDPKQSAQRRIQKQEREKKRRKRRVDERRHLRGGVAKRRHVDNS